MTESEQFEAFMREYQNMVFSTAMRLVANSAEAEDISQEVFLKAYQNLGKLEDPGGLVNCGRAPRSQAG